MLLVEIPPQTVTEDIDEEILDIFMEEVDEVREELTKNFTAWQQNRGDKNALQNLRRNFHTLKGSGRLVGANAIGELGWQFENLLNRVLDRSIPANDTLIQLMEQFPATLSRLLAQFKQQQPIDNASLLLISQAVAFAESKGQSLGDFSQTASTPVVNKIIQQPLKKQEKTENEGNDPELQHIFKLEASAHIKNLKDFLHQCHRQPPCYVNDTVVRLLHTLNGSARTVGFKLLPELAAEMEHCAKKIQQQKVALNQAQQILWVESVQMMARLLVQGETEAEDKIAHTHLISSWQQMRQLNTPPTASSHTPVEATPMVLDNSPDLLSFDLTEEDEPETHESQASDEFLHIFLEEAEEILENCQTLVARWQTEPNSKPLLKELQRELHTLKGGARMVGISAMGDLSHQLESVLTKIVEGLAHSGARLQNVVQESLDELAAMTEAVKMGETLSSHEELIQRIQWALDSDNEKPAEIEPIVKTLAQQSAPTPTPLPANASRDDITATVSSSNALSPDEERIRVRASLIDKLTNLSGELAISRAHMEQQQGAFKLNLEELGNTIMRLRDQLRRFEIETETQIISHYAISDSGKDEEFDPLELDRFSVMQQLSRSLMESVSDLLNLEEGLSNLVRRSETLLIQQTHIGAELQEGVMRTRMIPFAQISPRLQRIARLTARELNKNIDFIIENDSIEFERTILNRIVAPLEHMLRNAIGHGVEEIEARKALKKPAVAQVKLLLHKEGAELILTLSDDGRGLDLPAIREKAQERGLLKAGQRISHDELMQFILKPAFSTAKNLTQVSGRGVGMDIANTEIKQLGGSLRISSETGKGAQFEIRLPLSLTISKSLLVQVAEETLAIPLHNVEAVIRVQRSEVFNHNGQQPKTYRYLQRDYQIVHLGDLLGFNYQSLDTPMLPMLLVRSGDQSCAVLVDGIEGSKELVVKSVGPQLNNIRQIAGATILGDGRVVIILDMLFLVRSAQNIQLMSMADKNKAEESDRAANKIIMVVDDSITVRKVTARLLKRQGMDVITAKDGVDAIAQLQDIVPDLMLLDVEMPRMDGFELATQIRNDEALKHLPIIMITSRTGVKHRARAAKIGINKHLGKPFKEAELLENIHALLSK